MWNSLKLLVELACILVWREKDKQSSIISAALPAMELVFYTALGHLDLLGSFFKKKSGSDFEQGKGGKGNHV